MIGKIKKGSGFKGCVNYAMDKEQAVLLHTEGVLAENKQSIIQSFCTQREMNPNLKKAVGHIALSYSAVDAQKLTDEKMIQLAQEYMREMKITDTQYIIVRHQDREHPHVHLIFNRIDNNGKTISDKNDMYRNEQVCKKLKEKHGLYFAKGKEQVKQYRLKEPDKTKYEIYSAIKQEIGKSKGWKELRDQLAEKGIDIHFKYKGQTDEVQGISFSKGDYTFKGSEIDRSFSFSKLDKYLGDDNGLTPIGNKPDFTSSQCQLLQEPAGNPLADAVGTLANVVGDLFSTPMHFAPGDDEKQPYDPNLKKKKKKKRHFKL